jgi:hypothetical protein
VNGEYSWPLHFSANISGVNWQNYTYAGYNYVAESSGKVKFNANRENKPFFYRAMGGAPGSGVYLDLDTTFTGVVFSDFVGKGNTTERNVFCTNSDAAGKGSCSFINCQFLDYFLTGDSNYPFSGGKRGSYGSKMHWQNCLISICFDDDGGLFSGGDRFRDNSKTGGWKFINNTIVVQGIGQATFNGRNAGGPSGVYTACARITGHAYNQSQDVYKGNIIYNPGGSAALITRQDYLPSFKNNLLLGLDMSDHQSLFESHNNLIDVEPAFIDSAADNFNLRPNSPAIGKGL